MHFVLRHVSAHILDSFLFCSALWPECNKYFSYSSSGPRCWTADSADSPTFIHPFLCTFLFLSFSTSWLLLTNSPTRTHTHRFKDFLFIKRPAKSQSQSQIQSQPFGVAVIAKTKKRFPWPPASSSSFSFSSSPSPSFRSSSLCLVQGDKMVFLHGVGEIVQP